MLTNYISVTQLIIANVDTNIFICKTLPIPQAGCWYYIQSTSWLDSNIVKQIRRMNENFFLPVINKVTKKHYEVDLSKKRNSRTSKPVQSTIANLIFPLNKLPKKKQKIKKRMGRFVERQLVSFIYLNELVSLI